MVVLSAWQVVLSVPAGLDDEAARELEADVRRRLRAWLAAETARLSAIHEGSAVALDEE